MTGQTETFQARLTRINSGKTTSWTVPGAGIANKKSNADYRKVTNRKTVQARRPQRGLHRLLGLCFGVLAGALGVGVVRFIRWHYFGLSDEAISADMLLAIDAFAAIAFAYVVSGVFRFGGRAAMLAQMVGVLAMLASMHNLVWRYPDPFQVAFGTEWVARTLETTTPNTLQLRGFSYAW